MRCSLRQLMVGRWAEVSSRWHGYKHKNFNKRTDPCTSNKTTTLWSTGYPQAMFGDSCWYNLVPRWLAFCIWTLPFSIWFLNWLFCSHSFAGSRIFSVLGTWCCKVEARNSACWWNVYSCKTWSELDCSAFEYVSQKNYGEACKSATDSRVLQSYADNPLFMSRTNFWLSSRRIATLCSNSTFGLSLVGHATIRYGWCGSLLS